MEQSKETQVEEEKSDVFTEKARMVLETARDIAWNSDYGQIRTEHLLMALIETGDEFTSLFLNNVEFDEKELRSSLEDQICSTSFEQSFPHATWPV